MRELLSSLVAATGLLGLSQLEENVQGQTFPSDGLVSYWNFNEESGSIAKDFYGSNNGDLINGGFFNTDGKLGGGAYFGDNNHSSMRLSLSNINLSDYSFNMWIKIHSDNPDINELITAGPGTGFDGYISASFVGNRNLYFNQVVTSYQFSPDNWQMLTFKVNNGIGSVYENGEPIFTGSPSPPLIGTGIINFFGPWDNNFTRSLNGEADELGFWDRPLNQNEITSLYNNGFGVTIPEPTSATLLGLGALGLYAVRRKNESK